MKYTIVEDQGMHYVTIWRGDTIVASAAKASRKEAVAYFAAVAANAK